MIKKELTTALKKCKQDPSIEFVKTIKELSRAINKKTFF